MTNRRSRILQSPKLAQKKRKKLIITSLLAFACVILIIVVVILLFRLSALEVSTVEIIGNTTIESEAVRQKAVAELDGDYLEIIPKSSIFFYPKSNIEKSILDSFKKVDSLKIKSNGFSEIKIDIKERETVALVCNGFHDEEQSADQKCYSADKDGYVFEESPSLSEGVYPHYYVDLDSRGTSTIGNMFMDKDIFVKLQSFIDTLRDAHISVVGLLLGDKNQYELYIRNVDDTEAIVYFDDKIPFEKTASNLIMFWNDALIKNKNATTTTIFDYINLRFGNNIFYVTK